MNKHNRNNSDNFSFLIESKEHLMKIIKQYGSTAFRDVDLSKSFLNYLCEYFISRSDDKTRHSDEDRELHLETILDLFISELEEPILNHVSVPIASGTYGNIHNVCRDSKQIVKIFKNNKNKNYFSLNSYGRSSIFIMYTIELFVYITWIAILRFVMNEFPMYRTDYLENIAEIHRPFIYRTIIKSKTYHAFGYYMKKYDCTAGSILKKTKPHTINRSTEIINKAFEFLKKLQKLESVGVSLAHRDFTTNNIMINESNIVMIDFGFAATSVKFLNGHDWSVGHYFDHSYKNYISVVNDAILFTAYLCRYYPYSLHLMGIKRRLEESIRYRDNIRLWSINDNNTVWHYPFLAQGLAKDDLMNRIHSAISNRHT